MNNKILIEINNISAGYEDELVFKDLNLSFWEGQFSGIVGPTGSGKTTLLKTIMGTIKPLQGEINIGGGRIGYVPQLETVDWDFPVTVEQVVMMGLTYHGGLWPWPAKKDRLRAGELLDKLGLKDCAAHQIKNISGGQQQRTFLARAMISNPRILILDEPASGIDLMAQHDIFILLKKLNDEGMTIILTTHDLNSIVDYLPWVVCFNHGLIGQGKPYEILTQEVLKKTYGNGIDLIRNGKCFF